MSRHINKQELISKVRELAGLTNDEKSALLELLNEKKTYGLVWENHEEAVEEQLREQLPVLYEVPERRILSENSDAPNHIIIEAENESSFEIVSKYTNNNEDLPDLRLEPRAVLNNNRFYGKVWDNEFAEFKELKSSQNHTVRFYLRNVQHRV